MVKIVRTVDALSRTHALESTVVTDERICVLVVDDHAVVGQAFAALLNDEDDITFVGLATSVEVALTRVAQDRPDVVMLDHRLSDGTGLDAAREIRERWPSTQTIMVTAVKDPDLISAALDAGCRSFVPKDSDAKELIRAIRAAGRGESYLSSEVLGLLAQAPPRASAPFELSRRERQVLQLTADGASVDDIARKLYLSAHTVRNHLRHAMARVGVHTKLEAVVAAARAGIIRLGEPET